MNRFVWAFFLLLFTGLSLFAQDAEDTSFDDFEDWFSTEESDAPPPQYPSLSAVLVVGNVEGSTDRFMEEMDEIAEVFESHGIQVHRFYDDEANWDEIILVTPQANFFVYSGHGSEYGIGGTWGGLNITGSIYGTRIRDEMQLADNALILFKSVCGGAGSSASDDIDIGMEEAESRVSEYSNSFFEVGAGAYYANNVTTGCRDFLTDFLQGNSLSDCFVESVSRWKEIELEDTYDLDPTKRISIATSKGGGKATRITHINGVRSEEEIILPKKYSVAYVGPEGFSVESLVGVAR